VRSQNTNTRMNLFKCGTVDTARGGGAIRLPCWKTK